jgi:hypothetical protein
MNENLTQRCSGNEVSNERKGVTLRPAQGRLSVDSAQALSEAEGKTWRTLRSFNFVQDKPLRELFSWETTNENCSWF